METYKPKSSQQIFMEGEKAMAPVKMHGAISPCVIYAKKILNVAVDADCLKVHSEQPDGTAYCNVIAFSNKFDCLGAFEILSKRIESHGAFGVTIIAEAGGGSPGTEKKAHRSVVIIVAIMAAILIGSIIAQHEHAKSERAAKERAQKSLAMANAKANAAETKIKQLDAQREGLRLKLIGLETAVREFQTTQRLLESHRGIFTDPGKYGQPGILETFLISPDFCCWPSWQLESVRDILRPFLLEFKAIQ